MEALKFSILITVLLCACAYSEQNSEIAIDDNAVKGCIKITKKSVNLGQDPIMLSLSIDPEDNLESCPCKSSLMKYSAYQIQGEDISHLVDANFSSLGVNQISLPVAVQGRLLFQKMPIHVRISCAN